MRGHPHSPETKAAVVAALLAGQGVTEVAKSYSIDKSVVSRWWKAVSDEQKQQVTSKKADEFSDLLAAYLKANLNALRVQSELFADKDWLKRQNAADIAVLHGVATDKAVRLLEAAQAANEQESADE